MNGASRRAFQAEMCFKYCDGNARYAESIFGWGRQNVQVGLEERRSGIICVGLQSAHSGAKKWEEQYPSAAQSLRGNHLPPPLKRAIATQSKIETCAPIGYAIFHEATGQKRSSSDRFDSNQSG